MTTKQAPKFGIFLKNVKEPVDVQRKEFQNE